jgi:hypothetical protein
MDKFKHWIKISIEKKSRSETLVPEVAKPADNHFSQIQSARNPTEKPFKDYTVLNQ